MTHYKKYKIAKELYGRETGADIFHPEYVTRDYEVALSFKKFKLGRDYEVSPYIIRNENGLRIAKHELRFTDKGVKKLLKMSQKARARIDELWKDFIKD
ncbi:hypothetical protein [Campylobacter showae]|uniref:hypothetical protein n=1 Tax=Campylobacter showae TaxID=204 RepID=UPI0028E5393C|nr:hypothetical protein [Campylobacter showae]